MRRLPALTFLVLALAGCEPDMTSSLLLQSTFDGGDGGLSFTDGNGEDVDAHADRIGRAPGISGEALGFSGDSAELVRLPLSDGLVRAGDDITIALWARREVERNLALAAHAYPALFLGFHGPRFKWELRYASGGGASCYADWRYKAELGTWYHIAATFDGFAARLYVDGEEICTDWTRGGSIAFSDAPLTFGGYIKKDGSVEDQMVGRIDDIRVYAAALSGAQIAALHAARGPAAPAP